MDSLKYYVAISAACAFTLTPCSAQDAGHGTAPARPATVAPADPLQGVSPPAVPSPAASGPR